MNKKTGIIIGGVVGGLVIITGIIAAIFLLKGKTNDSYRVIKVMKAEGHWKHMSVWHFKAVIPYM